MSKHLLHEYYRSDREGKDHKEVVKGRWAGNGKKGAKRLKTEGTRKRLVDKNCEGRQGQHRRGIRNSVKYE